MIKISLALGLVIAMCMLSCSTKKVSLKGVEENVRVCLKEVRQLQDEVCRLKEATHATAVSCEKISALGEKAERASQEIAALTNSISAATELIESRMAKMPCGVLCPCCWRLYE